MQAEDAEPEPEPAKPERAAKVQPIAEEDDAYAELYPSYYDYAGTVDSDEEGPEPVDAKVGLTLLIRCADG